MMFKGKLKLSKIWKRILGGLFVVGASGFLLNGTAGVATEVHAQETQASIQAGTETNSTGIDKMEFVQIVDLILKLLYILLWPLLIIAGLALDNSLVYASFFNLDAPLWMFWNMMKNFANFALGFLVLFAIIRNIFSFGKAGDKRAPQKIITQTLIAGVLIQISWFAMAALVDLSTVATYAIGGLPLNVLGSTDLGDQKILKSHAELDMSKFLESTDSSSPFKARYSTNYKVGNDIIAINLSQCKTKHGYVVGRMDGGTGFKNDLADRGGTKNACVLGGKQIVFFNEFPNAYAATTDAEYQLQLEKNLTVGVMVAYDKREACKYIVRIKGTTKDLKSCDASEYDEVSTYINDPANGYDLTGYLWLATPPTTDADYGLEYGDTWLKNNPNALSLTELIDKSKGFVGPLVTMYSSLLNFTEIANTDSDTSFGEISGEMLIKIGFGIGLFFPLIALAVVLILRVAFLRAVIVTSPFLVLIEAFGWGDKLTGKLKEHFNLANVFKVIFAPVITVFALSLSLIFMSALVASLKGGGAHEAMGIKQTISENADTQGWTFWKDCAELEIEGFDIGGTMDGFSWFLVNIIAIGLMRAIVFAAIKANSIGKELGGKIQSFGANVFQTLPIVPVGPAGEKAGLGSIGRVLYNAPEQVTSNLKTTDEGRATKWVYGAEAEALNTQQLKDFAKKVEGGASIDAAIRDITGVKTAEKVTEVITTTGATQMYGIAAGLTGNAQTKFISELETPLGKNRFAKDEIETALKGVTDLATATTALGTITAKPTDIAQFNSDNITKKFGDIEYVISVDANNAYTFTPKPATP